MCSAAFIVWLWQTKRASEVHSNAGVPVYFGCIHLCIFLLVKYTVSLGDVKIISDETRTKPRDTA